MESGKSLGAANRPPSFTQGITLASTSCTESAEVDDFGPEDIVILYATGDYVTITYKGEVFSGQIVAVQPEGCVIKSMVKSGFYRKWPKDEDILFFFVCHIYLPFTRKRIVLLYFGQDVHTLLEFAIFKVSGPPIFHIKVGAFH